MQAIKLMLSCAHDSLNLIATMRAKQRPVEYRQFISVLEIFAIQARKSHMLESQIQKAHYLLAAGLDEAAFSCDISYPEEDYSLVNTYHYDNASGDNFFKRLNEYINDSKENMTLIALAYLILSLGFQGKYAIQPDGSTQLIKIRNQLYKCLEADNALKTKHLGLDNNPLNQSQRKTHHFYWIYLTGLLLLGFSYIALHIILQGQFNDLTHTVNHLSFMLGGR